MAIIILRDEPTREDIRKSREEHPDYIKITADVDQKVLAISGEYHADAEKVLLEKYGSLQKNIWGGGYNLLSNQIETIAIINMRNQPENRSMDILDPKIRADFISLVSRFFSDIKSLI